MNKFSFSDKDRFWKLVNSRQGGQCWIWDGSLRPSGYGQFHYNNTNHYAHRIVWEMYCGSIPADMLVLHKCDIKRCVNPDHLYLGTHSDNLRDRYERFPEYRAGYLKGRR